MGFSLYGTKPTPHLNYIMIVCEIIQAIMFTVYLFIPTETIISICPFWITRILVGSLPINPSADKFPLYMFLLILWLYRIRFCYSVYFMLRGSSTKEVLLSAIIHPLIDILWVSQFMRNFNQGSTASTVFLYISLIIFITGAFIGTKYEIDRRNFIKLYPNKLYTGGFGKLVRCPQYFSDLLTSTGWLICTNSWWPPVVFFILQTHGFVTDYIPALMNQLDKEFPDQHKKYVKSVPYVLIPYIW
eukprot:TRINITY_DN12186_c0_g1_i1.p1 TRINITY_DN12186_c0_g1~~TRINITY_DN12186_c0_g1_i1.p1  ORF type:complete len:244 (-),score=19.58 TRINITY_DN12186_c0_g1_i1:11-742(-)